jgi:hypothetical protein
LRTYKTPGVYVEEVSLLPPSVAEVATAIPAFVGYTERAERNGASLLFRPVRIKSLLEYHQYFGGHLPAEKLTVELHENDTVAKVKVPRYYLYDSLQLYFANGGGSCYIVSVGDYSSKVDKQALIDGLDSLRKEDEPTMLVIPDAMLLEKEADIADIQQRMLAQCEELQDRVGILDVKCDPDLQGKTVEAQITAFRNGIGMRALRLGAAYYPYVRTSLPCSIRYKDITFMKKGGNVLLASLGSPSSAAQRAVEQLDQSVADGEILRSALRSAENSGKSYPKYFEEAPGRDRKAELYHYAFVMKQIALRVKGFASGSIALRSQTVREVAGGLVRTGGRLEELVKKLMRLDLAFPFASENATEPVPTPKPTKEGKEPPAPPRPATGGKELGAIKADEFKEYNLPGTKDLTERDREVYGKSPASEAEAVQTARPEFRALFAEFYSLLITLQESAERTVDSQEEVALSCHPVLQRAVDALRREATTLPPSGAVAGVYAYVDKVRGVWKAPANASLSAVVEPAVKLDSRDQENLNVDVDAGKSVNAIRAFAGQGTLVWGARTLAGNDNEWRYVSVRRFYNMAEESIKKSTYWAVFEPNDRNTWVRVKSMVENYLIHKWREGALVGAKPDEAFFVKVGLGVTMTPVDVLEGRMNVEIGMAVVRPMEFIALRFSHKMQTA